jgi:purine-binding chemotaxis protein CheW
MNLNTMLGLSHQDQRENQKIIVLVPEAVSGSNVGIIVDDVIGVLQVAENDIERLGEGLSSEVSDFVKGIIKLKRDDADKKSTSLIIWIDMQKVIDEVAKK